MHVHRTKYKRGDKVYEQILLRESYREPGAPRSAVKKRTILNLTKFPENEIKAIELALKHKNDPKSLQKFSMAKFTKNKDARSAPFGYCGDCAKIPAWTRFWASPKWPFYAFG